MSILNLNILKNPSNNVNDNNLSPSVIPMSQNETTEENTNPPKRKRDRPRKREKKKEESTNLTQNTN